MPKIYTVADITDDRPFADKERIVADWNATEAARPEDEWRVRIAASDALLPRPFEDLLDRDGVDGLPAALVSKYRAKKGLRAARPRPARAPEGQS